MKMFRFRKQILAGFLGFVLVSPLTARAAGGDPSFEERVGDVVRQFDADVAADSGFSGVLSLMLATEYGTPQDDLEWALEHSIDWGRIAILSYMGATTGRGFGELALAHADTDVAGFLAQMELSPDKMIDSLEGLARRVARERNSKIFDRLRSARDFSALPDLGAGFGLFQEALDFRQIEPPAPTKLHTGPAFLVKGDGGKQ